MQVPIQYITMMLSSSSICYAPGRQDRQRPVCATAEPLTSDSAVPVFEVPCRFCRYCFAPVSNIFFV